ncbi:MAG: rRNA maturation RNase YbeY [Candidatus Omnitrophota bacterium]
MKTVKSKQRCRIHCVVLQEHPRLTVRSTLLKTFVKNALVSLHIRQAKIVLVLGDQALVRRLNRLFLHRDRPTDVLAFDFSSKRSAGEPLAADIVVCLDSARRKARELRISFRQELLRYVLHGLLHLAGYDDRTASKKRWMWKRQEALLKEIT